MRSWLLAFILSALMVAGFVMVAPDSAEARRCYTFKASHNGTDAFNPNGGAAGTATNKLLQAIEAWKQGKGIKRVRIGKVRTKCGEWYMMYFLMHHTCTARARVCR